MKFENIVAFKKQICYNSTREWGIYMTLGELIHIRRKELNLTLEEVGNAVGVSKSTVRKWETGYISNMKRDKIALLSKTLKLNPAQFIVEPDKDINSTNPHQLLIDKYDSLNKSGQSKLMERLDELLELPKYRKEWQTFVLCLYYRTVVLICQ